MNPLQTVIKRFRDLQPRQQMVLVGGFLVVLVSIFIFFTLITRTSWVIVESGLNPSDAPKVSESLSAAGIENQIVQGGTAIQVPEGQSDQARATAATTGSATSGQVGFELFDKNNLGATDLQQQVQYQRALEGEISRVIDNVDGVASSQVQLVLKEDQMFTVDGSPASASVLLQADRPLEAAQIAGIAKLVQGAVPALKADAITITDQTGNILWPNSGSGGGATSKAAAQARYGAEISQRLQSLISQSLGTGKSQVQVSADLNMDKTSTEQLKYGPKEGIPLTQAQQDENLNSTGGGGGGGAGTGANIPTYGTGGTGDGSTQYTNKKNDQTFGVDKTVTRTVVAEGAVNRLQVAVILDQDVPAATVTALQQTLAAAAGIDPQRGDTLSISQVQFAPIAAPTGPGPLQAYGGYLRWLLLIVAALGFLFFVRRGLQRRESAEIDMEPSWLSDLESQSPSRPPSSPGMPSRNKSDAQQQVEQMADQDPEQVAAQVRDWINND
jgi:flagellar M-ring protein FliF